MSWRIFRFLPVLALAAVTTLAAASPALAQRGGGPGDGGSGGERPDGGVGQKVAAEF